MPQRYPHSRSPAPRRHARGVSLIEVLVSTVVVAVGALSATTLQVVSKRNNWEAAQRLQATHLASTLVERMRANNSPESLTAYVTTAATTVGMERVAAALGLDCEADPTSCCTQESHECTEAEVVAVELWQWEQLMDGQMERVTGSSVSPGGLDRPTACITGPATPGTAGFYTVTIAFRGTLAIAEDTTVACGHDAAYANGGPSLYGDDNEYRRTLTVSAYIKPTVRK